MSGYAAVYYGLMPTRSLCASDLRGLVAVSCLASLRGRGGALACIADLEPEVATLARALSIAERFELPDLGLEELGELCRVAIELRRRKEEYEEARERDSERASELASRLHELLGELHSIVHGIGEGVLELVEALAEIDVEREARELAGGLRRRCAPRTVERLLDKFESELRALLETLGIQIDLERESEIVGEVLVEILEKLERAGILEVGQSGIYARLEVPRVRIERVRLVDERGVPTRPLLAVLAASELEERGILLLSWEVPPPMELAIRELVRVALGVRKIAARKIAPVLREIERKRINARLELPAPEHEIERRAVKYFLLSKPLEHPLVLGSEGLLDAALREFGVLGAMSSEELLPETSRDFEVERHRLLEAVEEARESYEPCVLVEYLRDLASRIPESSGEERKARLAILGEGEAVLGL